MNQQYDATQDREPALPPDLTGHPKAALIFARASTLYRQAYTGDVWYAARPNFTDSLIASYDIQFMADLKITGICV